MIQWTIRKVLSYRTPQQTQFVFANEPFLLKESKMRLKNFQNLTKMVKYGQKWPFFDAFLDKNGQKIT